MRFNDAFGEQERRIVGGFLELVRKKPYEKVTVKELAARCSISRTVFYRSFSDIYDLMERLERYLLDELVLYRPRGLEDTSGESTAGMPYESIEAWFATAVRLRPLLAVVMGENGDLYFKERLIVRLRVELSQMMDDEGAPADVLRSYYVAAISASYIGLLQHIALHGDEADSLAPHAVADIANSMRVAYFTSSEAPAISDERLYGSRG